MLRNGVQVIALALLWGGWLVPPIHAVDFSWTASGDVLVPLLNSQDADAGVIQNGPDLDVQMALYPDWPRYRGTNLDNLVAITPAQRDATFNKPNGDDAYWTNGMWQDATGKRYAIIHIEYNYREPRQTFFWKRRIGLATSTDRGANWKYSGDIITTSPSRAGAPLPTVDFQDFGCGDTYLHVDRRNGYFYVYYMTAWVYSPTGWRTKQEMCVARCLISDKMAPGKWKKWNGTNWTQSGLGGSEAAVFSDTDAAVIHYNTYLQSFVAIGHDSDSRSWISSATDLTTQNWQARDYTFPQRLYWYNWPIDPVTNDRSEIGQTFRLYSAQANVGGNGTKYFTLSLSKNGNLAPTANLIQPEESASFYSPGPITLLATANDNSGAISKVEFFANLEKIGEVTTAPYIFIWKNVPVGNYRLSARSTDLEGASTTSAGVNIAVTALSFNLWKTLQGIPIATPGTSLSANGRPILLEYALNLEPNPSPILEAGLLKLTYVHARSDITYLVERSTDLKNWSATSVAQGTPSPLLFTASTLMNEEKVFLHLRVSYP